MKLLGFLLIGLAAGWLAGKATKSQGFGVVGSLIVGVVGSFLGVFLFNLIGWKTYGVAGTFTSSFVGAVVLVLLAGALRRATSRKEN
jgi:uncharacterized membrane protein YeaQ/YmgE (transglycosylase-associated protein family)